MAKEEVVVEAASTTAIVVEKIISAVGPAISKIAECLGVTSEHVMTVLTKQAAAGAISEYACAIAGMIVAIGWWRFSVYWGGKIKNENWDADGGIANIIISCFIYLFCMIFIMCGVVVGTKMLINPEYYALKEVMDMIIDFKSN